MDDWITLSGFKRKKLKRFTGESVWNILSFCTSWNDKIGVLSDSDSPTSHFYFVRNVSTNGQTISQSNSDSVENHFLRETEMFESYQMHPKLQKKIVESIEH
jgi:hypothetical protein